MKFPTATVVLVSAALLFVFWSQTRDAPVPPSADQFSDLSARPADRSAVVDWVVGEVPRLCQEATGAAQGSQAVKECLATTESRESACRRMAIDEFPSLVASEQVFRDLSITMMGCLVRQSRPLENSLE